MSTQTQGLRRGPIGSGIYYLDGGSTGGPSYKLERERSRWRVTGLDAHGEPVGTRGGFPTLAAARSWAERNPFAGSAWASVDPGAPCRVPDVVVPGSAGEWADFVAPSGAAASVERIDRDNLAVECLGRRYYVTPGDSDGALRRTWFYAPAGGLAARLADGKLGDWSETIAGAVAACVVDAQAGGPIGPAAAVVDDVADPMASAGGAAPVSGGVPAAESLLGRIGINPPADYRAASGRVYRLTDSAAGGWFGHAAAEGLSAGAPTLDDVRRELEAVDREYEEARGADAMAIAEGGAPVSGGAPIPGLDPASWVGTPARERCDACDRSDVREVSALIGRIGTPGGGADDRYAVCGTGFESIESLRARRDLADGVWRSLGGRRDPMGWSIAGAALDLALTLWTQVMDREHVGWSTVSAELAGPGWRRREREEASGSLDALAWAIGAGGRSEADDRAIALLRIATGDPFGARWA